MSESGYHLNSVHTVEPVHSFLLPPQRDAFVYLAKLPPQDNCSEHSDSIHQAAVLHRCVSLEVNETHRVLGHEHTGECASGSPSKNWLERSGKRGEEGPECTALQAEQVFRF